MWLPPRVCSPQLKEGIKIMKDLLKKIEEATKEKAVLLYKKEYENRGRYQIALISDEYGVDMFLSIAYAQNDNDEFWYIEDVCSVSKLNYCVLEYTISKIKEVLKQCGQ